MKLFIEGSGNFLGGRCGGDPRLGTKKALGATTGKLTHLFGAGTVPEGEPRLDTELPALLEQRTAGGIHSAVEHSVWGTALELREDRLPVHRLVCALLSRQHVDSGGLERLFDFVCQTLAIRRRIVNDRDNLWF